MKKGKVFTKVLIFWRPDEKGNVFTTLFMFWRPNEKEFFYKFVYLLQTCWKKKMFLQLSSSSGDLI
jgi:hypothetical protein